MSDTLDETVASLAPCLLVAIPQMNDPHFQKSVVLLVNHDADGAFGLVLNRPLNLTVTRMLELAEGTEGWQWSGPSHEPVYGGGPVMPQGAWLLHSPPALDPALPVLNLDNQLICSGHLHYLKILLDHRPEFTRFFLGSSGWTTDQLEEEIGYGWWLTLPLDTTLICDTPPSELWLASLAQLGIDPATFSFEPEEDDR